MAMPRLPQALRHADFRDFTAARVLWQFASQVLTIAVGYNVYMISHDPLDLGWVGLSQFLPSILLTLPAGELADTFDRRRLLTICYGLLAVCAAMLIAASIIGPSSTLPIIAVMTLYGGARAMALPSSQALVPNLVPPADLPGAIAVTSTLNKVATVVGPAVGGFLLLAGSQVPYVAGVALLGLATLLAARVKGGGRPAGGPARERVSVASLLSGINFVRHKPVILGSISLDMFAVLFGGAVALLPIYATDILRVGPSGLGVLRAAPAVGALAAALLLSVRPLEGRVGIWLFGSVGVFGASTVVFALSTDYALSLAALMLVGCSDMVSVYARHLIVQFATPDAIRGRVSAVNAVFVGASNELGEFESGVTAAWWGPVAAALVGGIVTIAVAMAWAGIFPTLRTMDRFPGLETSRARGPDEPLDGDLVPRARSR